MALVPEADAIEAARSALIRLPLAVLGFGTPPRADAGSEEAISSLAVMADGRLVSRSTDGTIRLWPTGGNDKAVVLSPSSGEWSLADERLRASDKSKAVLEDGRLATAGQDGEIKIWPKKGTGEPEIISSSNSAMSLAVLKDGRLAAGGFDGNITLLRTDQGTFRNGEPLVLFHTDDWYGGSSGKAVEALAVLPDGRLASGGQADLGGIKIWPTGAAGEPVVLWDHYVGAMTSLAVLADGRLASGVQDGTIRLWVKDVKGFADKPQNVLTHGNQIMSLAVLADGRLASSGDDDDGTIKLWRKEGTGEPIAVLRHGSPVGRIVALKDGRLASGDDDGTIKLWSTEDTGMVTGLAAVRPTREPVAVLRHGSRLSSLAVLEDGRLASGDDDGKIDIWAKDVEGFADKPEKVLTHGSQVLSLAVLADGRLASGGGDGTIKLWAKDAKDFADKPEKVLSQGSSSIHWEGIQSLAVLADRWLASGGADGLIKLWSTEVGGEPVVLSGPGSPGHALMGHGLGSGVSSLAVLPDGRLASAGYDGEIKLWLVDEQKLIGALCLRAGRNLTQGEWDRYIGPDIPWQESCRPFGVPSNWRTVDENKSGAPRPQ
jgi:WD40 repeat protein